MLGSRARRVLFAAAVVAAMAPRPAGAAWHALEEIPVESPVYRLVDALVTSYGSPSACLTTRPWDRAQLGRFLDELVANEPQAANDPAVARLRRELSPGGGLEGVEPAIALENDEQSIELSPYARADYFQDRARGTIARDLRAGGQISAAFGAQALLFADGYVGTPAPLEHGNPADSRRLLPAQPVRTTADYDRAYAAWRGRWLALRAGHTWLRWGPGANGTMALSDGAPAMDLAEARIALPARMQFAWFVASLDPAAQTYLAGHRLELRPDPSWDVALAELARFDGAANVPLYAFPLVPYRVISNRVVGTSALPADSLDRFGRNHVLWDADFSWRARPGARVYGELAVDDIRFGSSRRPRAMAWQIGAEARGPFSGGALTARAEYARVYQYTYSISTHHDFAFAGQPTGFALGPDVDLVSGRLEWRPDAWWAGGVEGAFSRKGEGQLGQAYVPGSPVPNTLVLSGVLDEDRRIAATVDFSPSASVALGATLGVARVHDLGHVPGRDTRGAYGSTRCTLRW